jgi:hypothetical protein
MPFSLVSSPCAPSASACQNGSSKGNRNERSHGTVPKAKCRARASQMPMLPNLMPDLDQLMSALFLVALLLYLIPAVFGVGHSAEGRRWIQRGAILTLGTAIAIAVVASIIWFAR